jgi:type IV pilus assembly protein PilQ
MRHLRTIRMGLGDGSWWRSTALILAVATLAAAGAVAADDVGAPASAPAVAPTTAPATAPTSVPTSGPEAVKPNPGDDAPVKTVQSGVFDIHARDTDLRAVLTLLSNQGRKNIIATKEVSGKVSADLYGVTFKEALDAILRTTGFRYEERGNFVYVYTPEQYDKLKKDERRLQTKTFRLTYITAKDAQVLVTPALSQDAIIAITPSAGIGIAPSKVDTGGNSLATEDVLVIRDDEEHLAKVAEMLREIDVKPEQVLIEATILRASLSENTQLGIDFNILAGIDFEQLGGGTLTPADIATPGVAPSAGFSTDFAGGVDKGGLSFGLITNNIAMFVRAMESITPTTVLANPKLLIMNKQRGEVLVGNRDGYITTTFTETNATQTVQFLETGTRLIVRPYIGKNGQIRLEIHPEDSSGSVSQVGNNALPSQTTTEVTTNVMVRDGHTIVLGGLFRERTIAGRSQIPVLGNLPCVGALFRRTADNTQREEVIILITPRIIKQAVDESTSEQLKDDIERYRVGARQGLQWFGRDRLSQCWMRAARKCLNAGNLDKALWDVDMALSLNPQLAEAIELKEQLTDKAYWADEARVSDARFVVERLIMQELGKPFETIVPPDKPLHADQIPADVRDAFGISRRYLEPLPLIAQPEMPMQPCAPPVDKKDTATQPAVEAGK